MIIAISQRVIENESYPERRDALSQEWVTTFRRFMPEAVLVPIPNRLPSMSHWLATVGPEAIILSGGNDWGEAPERDSAEMAMVDHALAHSTPLLGVCRGLHVINKHFGGTITTSLQAVSGANHVACLHEIAIEGEVFVDLAGDGTLVVNSYHDQGVLDVAPGLCVFATAGPVVEGLHHDTAPILAVQWHPERDGSPAAFDFAIIRRLIAEGAFWAGKGSS